MDTSQYTSNQPGGNTPAADAIQFYAAIAGMEPSVFQTFGEAGKARLDELKKKGKDGHLSSAESKELCDLELNQGLLIHTLYGAFPDLHAKLEGLNRRGAGVYLTINRTDGPQRRAENIVGLRASFIDGDGIPMPIRWPIDPNVICQRDHTHWHAYWLLRPGEPLDAFKSVQKQLAAFYGSDPRVCDLSRVMRMPGFLHLKGVPTLYHLVRCMTEHRYTIKEILAAHPLPEPAKPEQNAPSSQKAESGRERAALVRRARRYAEKMKPSISGQGGHDAAFHVACRVVHGFGLTVEEGLEALVEWNKICKPEWSEKELRHKVEEALKQPGPRGFLLTSRQNEGGKRRPPLADLAEVFLRDKGYMTKAGLGLRFYRGSYYRFSHTHYEEVMTGDLLAEIIRFLQDDPELRRFATGATAKGILANLDGIGLVPASMELPIWLGEMPGSRSNWVAMANGILDVERLLGGHPQPLFQHSPSFFTLVGLPYPFDPTAKWPTWAKFLAEVLPDPAVRSLLQEWFGYCLVYDTSLQKFLLLVGEGANGKSVILTVLREMLGPRNVSAVGLEAFNAERTFPLAATVGKLANISAEISECDRAAEGLIKQHVAGDLFTIERKFKDAFETVPTARLVFSTNNLPRFVDRSDGLWRRVLLIVITFQVTDASKQDKRLVRTDFWRGSGELAGVFNWALEGLRRLRQRGHFEEPETCRAARDAYRRESNPASVFLTENYRADPKGRISSKDLYTGFKDWAEKFGYRPLCAQQFAKEVRRTFPSAELSQHAQEGGFGGRSRVWSGIEKVNRSQHAPHATHA